jgi:hypothetical protein
MAMKHPERFHKKAAENRRKKQRALRAAKRALRDKLAHAKTAEK